MMQPDLNAGADRLQGPQIFADGAGRVAEPADNGAILAAYHGRLPDYVLGTDAKRAAAWPDERAALAAPAQDEPDERAAPPEDATRLTRTAYNDASPPPSPHRPYSSLDGGPTWVIDAADRPADDEEDDEPTGH